MQAASPAAAKRRLRQRARLLVQGIDAAPAAEQTETGFDAGRAAPRVQADRQSAVIVDAASPAKADMQRTCASEGARDGAPAGIFAAGSRLRCGNRFRGAQRDRRLDQPADVA